MIYGFFYSQASKCFSVAIGRICWKVVKPSHRSDDLTNRRDAFREIPIRIMQFDKRVPVEPPGKNRVAIRSGFLAQARMAASSPMLAKARTPARKATDPIPNW
jgi:hypothetical protein